MASHQDTWPKRRLDQSVMVAWHVGFGRAEGPISIKNDSNPSDVG